MPRPNINTKKEEKQIQGNLALAVAAHMVWYLAVVILSSATQLQSEIHTCKRMHIQYHIWTHYSVYSRTINRPTFVIQVAAIPFSNVYRRKQ